MSERKRTMEIRGIPHMTAFMGTIGGITGLWWRDRGGVYALDCRQGEDKVPFTQRPGHSYFHGPEKEVTDYQGPVDILIKVRGFSPWRGKTNNGYGNSFGNTAGQSHVRVEYAKPKDYSKGPRAVRLRDDDE